MLVVVAATLLAGCGRQSILDTHSPQAHNIALLWWWMLAAATLVFLGAVGLLVLAWFRRDRKGLPFFGERESIPEAMVLLFGIGVPLVALIALFGVSDVYLIRQTSPPNPRTTAMTIDVIGHQWWWEVRYPGTKAVTANEIHIPVRTRVNVVATTADVIHSFWVPALNRKIDMVPGRQNRVLLTRRARACSGAVLAVLRTRACGHGDYGRRPAPGCLSSLAGEHGVACEAPRRPPSSSASTSS